MRTLSAFALCMCLSSAGSYAQQIISGRLTSFDLPDARGNNHKLPLDKKVTAVFYTDPDARDVINPLSEVMEKKGLPKKRDKFIGLGVINCKDTWMPNAVMRAAVRQKEKDDPNSVILFDKNRTLSKAWNLGDCDDACVLVIIGADGLVKYTRAVRSQDECRTIITPVMKLLEDEVAKVN